MTVLNLGIVAAGWLVAGVVWWSVLARVGFRFEVRGEKARIVAQGLEATLQDRASRLDREIARQRASHAALN